jgi:hypothetical protein
MRVRTQLEHRDHADRTRHPGDEYDTEPMRAEEMARAGYVLNLDAPPEDPRWITLHRGGRILTPFPVASKYEVAPEAHDDLRVLQLTQYDPGSAGYRYHSAFNTVPGLRSAFVRYGHSNPFSDLRQYDGERQAAGVSALFAEADAVHVHMTFDTLEAGVRRWPDRSRQLLVRHYHGSDATHNPGTTPRFMENDVDAEIGALQIGARLYHNRYSDRMHWVPIPVPVLDYASLRAMHFVPMEEREKKVFRLCHSPTHWRVKGTVALEHSVTDLQMAGLPIELIMIRDVKHGEALRIKATCDATFDSFWLGIQGSGLEAAAMGQPAIAGDPLVVEDYAKAIGYTPYTYVADVEQLKATITRMVEEPAFVAAEAERVRQYVLDHHDYPAVGRRYQDVIRQALAERGLRAAAA